MNLGIRLAGGGNQIHSLLTNDKRDTRRVVRCSRISDARDRYNAIINPFGDDENPGRKGGSVSLSAARALALDGLGDVLSSALPPLSLSYELSFIFYSSLN